MRRVFQLPSGSWLNPDDVSLVTITPGNGTLYCVVRLRCGYQHLVDCDSRDAAVAERDAVSEAINGVR